MNPSEARRVEDVQIQSKMKEAYLDYSMSVIVGRALPDVRDGLKPVHRRILYAMHDMGLRHNKPYKKSARVVGDVLGKYHPHGDTAVYDAMVRMAQDFSLRYRLVDGQGNYGSLDGDSAAAMRYTEARLTEQAEEMLEDLDKETVDWKDNFDGSMKEPAVLPAKLPNLLVNGASGIAVGMATNIPPHNLTEVIDAAIHLIDNPKAEITDLMDYVEGPDFPTAGEIIGREGIYQAYKTGRGKITVRGKTRIDEDQNQIIIDSIPYQVKKSKIVEQIAELVKEDKIQGISDLRDESDREGLRVVIELKRDANPEVVQNRIYKSTTLETTFGINNLSIVDNEPEVLSLKEMLQHYIDHRTNVVKRRTQYLLKGDEKRLHIVKGLTHAVENIDTVLELLQSSEGRKDAMQKLQTQYNLTEKQTKAILNMRLQRLTKLEKESLKKEHKSLKKSIEQYKNLLSKRQNLLDRVKKELVELKENHGDTRKTQIKDGMESIQEIDLIPKKQVTIFLTEQGYIKRTPLSEYRIQNRSGTGIIGTDLKQTDQLRQITTASTHDMLLLFTNQGNVYWLETYRIPEYSRRSRGKPIVNLLQLDKNEKITTIIPTNNLEKNIDLLFTTKQGYIKRTPLKKYSNPRKTGIIAIDLKPNDQLIDVKKLEKNQKIIIATKNGQLTKFNETEVRPTGRNTMGVIGMRLEQNDEVIGATTTTNNQHILTVSENGYGKLTPTKKYRQTHRGSKGVITLKTNKRNGKVKKIEAVNKNQYLMLATQKGMTIRIPITDISIQSRNTQGVKLMQTKNDKITDIQPTQN
ncbi:Type IIA topoisomerase A subunit GyrA [Methanonatronarchaeum thermophilum]|uniref:DNA gyrase subunit A n=1 Tax=Methanonatronarchaeum thermophilum TaxID=1927129 RepID=A0A1Y3GD06_9EURY|nr:DNA gyrase subunit A [Methanonatronarchaeum thermophilum]OUJ19279.1 Type IIA topoisomerase A subunit GyrA [Methanonatronarchaeum thermophilum]